MKWLHISDLHFGYQAATVAKMRKQLLAKADELENIDYLFITGDLRYGKKERMDYPAETLKFVEDLQRTLGVSKENTFVVPGNHDVNRDEGELQAVIEAATKKYSTSNGQISNRTLEIIKAQRLPFLNLYRQICGREEPGWHYCLSKDGVNIICLNTALFCCKDGEDGNLILGSELLNELSEAVDNRKPGIVLAHHDFDAFSLEEQQNLEITLKNMGAVLYLCGHKHVVLGRCQNTYQTNKDLYVFLCGTNMDWDPNLTQTDMDFFVGEIDDTGSRGTVQAYKWHSRLSCWLPDIEFSHPQGGATDGIRYFPAECRPSEEKKVNKDVVKKYNQYIRRQCSEIELNGLPTNAEDVGRKYALESIFVPVSFKHIINRDIKDEMWESSHIRDDMWLLNSEKEETLVSLSKLIPESGCFRNFILSDPGGGKTTLLKLLASVYCFPEEYEIMEVFLPKRKLFPVWVRCRDIPEGSRPSIWSTIENIARLGEWMPHGSDVEDFTRLVSKHIQEGTMLLLIDGLDEVGSEAERQHFVEQLRTFADNNPLVNIIVSSRPTGFSIVTKGEFPDFKCFEIARLKKNDVKEICVKWYKIVYGDGEDIRKKAERLANKVTGNERIFRLASNPLMLTTLLLVERRVGRLPTKRAALYDEAIQVLLETWNQVGYGYAKVDLEEARYQLAYVAFQMMSEHKKRINKTELRRLLGNVRQDFSELVSNEQTILSFINNVEKRSALLIQKGYEQLENGVLDPVYEFQHLTFQEYLAAYAVANRCYPDMKEEDNAGSILKSYLVDTTMKEVISLSATLNRFVAKELTDEILSKIEKEEMSFEGSEQLRTHLLQFVADEVQLKEDIIDKILESCFATAVWISDLKIIRQILEGRYANKLREFFANSDKESNDGYDNWESMLDILTGSIANPYQYYMDNRCSESLKQKVKAISVLSNALWMDYPENIKQVNKTELEKIKEELYAFAESEEPHIVKAVLFMFRENYFIKSKEDFSRYLTLLARYTNKEQDTFAFATIGRLQNIKEDVKIECNIRLSDETYQEVLREAKDKEVSFVVDYGELLTLALLATLCCTETQDLSEIYSAISMQRNRILKYNPFLNDTLHGYDETFARVLQQSVLVEDNYKKRREIVQKYILQTDLVWVQKRLEMDMIFYKYTDYSMVSGKTFSLSISSAVERKQVEEYIHSRIEKIDHTK